MANQQLSFFHEMIGKTIKSVVIEDGERAYRGAGGEDKILVVQFTDGSEIRIKSSLGHQGIYNSNGGYVSTWPTLEVATPQ
jgi:hypothetical protein